MHPDRNPSSSTSDPRPADPRRGHSPGYPEERPDDKEDARKSGPEQDRDRDEGGMDREPIPDGDSADK